MTRPAPDFRRHAIVFAAILVVDQLTKWWARARFSLPDGEPDWGEHIAVLGDWLHFRLVYNYGAAFGTRPQDIAPFLHPMLFYAIFSAIAIGFFAAYYVKLGFRERLARFSIALILSGAIGNLIDRMAMGRVTDFLDAGIPGFYPRWPVFNIADSAVFIGMLLLIVPPFLPRRRTQPDETDASDATDAPDAQDSPADGGDAHAPGAGHGR